MFSRDPSEELRAAMRPDFIREIKGQVDSDENVWNYCIGRVQRNFNAVISLSPFGEQFQRRNLKFSGLFNGCTIDWFQPWPRQGLASVTSNNPQQVALVVQGQNFKDSVSEPLTSIHKSVADSTEDYFGRFRR
jgi:dynein heavy chain